MTEPTFKAANWWPTPTLTVEQADATALNTALSRIIREKEREILSRGKPSPVAGLEQGLTAHWLEYNVLNWSYPECKELRRLVMRGFREFVALLGASEDPGMQVTGISCWANVLRPGQALQVHHHDPAFASAHYTVETGYGTDEPSANSDSGHTIYFRPGFLDRSHGGKQNGPTSPWDDDWRRSSRPKPGNLMFFPSYVRHEVRPNLAAGERISIAMDIFVKRQETLMYFGGPRWFVPKGTELA
jgi:hypothetical protein